MSALEIIPLTYPLSDRDILSFQQPVSLAIGHFDGVHRGHQNVIMRAVEVAKKAGITSAVMTFDPHPKEVLGHGDHYYQCLTPLPVKTELFSELGVDRVYVMKFNLQFAAVTPQHFVESVLRPLTAKHVVVGFDFTFGNRGLGNTDVLRELSAPDIAVHIVEPLYEQGTKVSSTYTREVLEEGDLPMAERLLGRPYEIVGTVEHGDGRGSSIGFPTANLRVDYPYVAPRLGVYAITATIEGEAFAGVMNYGVKPTFNKQGMQPVMEAHLFDFDRNIYGQAVKIQFRSFIRPEQKFNSVTELVAQIGLDANRARQLLLGK